MTNDPKRQAALNEIRQNIAEKGFHTYVVTGGGVPHYGYTIGLSESLGAELILAGAYFYELSEVSRIIKSIAGDLRSPAEWEKQSSEAPPWGTFSYRKIHLSWAERLMQGVCDYYQATAVAAYQLVPDEAHRTIEIPDLSQPFSSKSAPGWQWLNDKWPFPVPIDSVAITNLDALRGARVTEVMRWEQDEWEIFAGAGPDTTDEDRRVVPLGVLLAADSSLLPAVHLPIGSGFWRDAQMDWHPWGNSSKKDKEDKT